MYILHATFMGQTFTIKVGSFIVMNSCLIIERKKKGKMSIKYKYFSVLLDFDFLDVYFIYNFNTSNFYSQSMLIHHYELIFND